MAIILVSFPFVMYTLSLSLSLSLALSLSRSLSLMTHLFNRISELNSNILCRVKGGTSPPGFQIISHFPYVLTFFPFSFTVCDNIPPPWKTYKAAPISLFPVVRDIKTSMI